MLVSLYTSRVVLNTLGVVDYGIYNVVGGVVTMFGFLNGAMASATQRFLSFELGSNNFIQLRKIFNVSQIIHILIASIVLILAETVGLWFLNNYLNIPEERMDAARWVYHFSVLSLTITIIQVPYNSIILARERMNIYAYVSIFEVLLKLLTIFILVWFTYDKLKLYGILLFLVSIIIAITYRVYAIKNFEETHFLKVKEKKLYRTLINYSGWSMFGAFSMIAKGQGVSIILNMFFGTVVNAAQGIANMINSSINSFVSNFQMASNPQIVKSYASNDKSYMSNLIIRTAKFSFYLLFILTLPVLLEIEYILEIWLKIVPEYTVLFTVLILFNAWVDSISGPLITAVHATGKIKYYQIVVGIIFTLNLPLSYILFSLGYSPESAFIVNICITTVVFIIRLYFTKYQIPEFPVLLFLKDVIIRSIPIIFLSGIVPYFIKINMTAGLKRLLMISFISLIINILLVYFLGFRKSEKKFIKEYLFRIITKK